MVTMAQSAANWSNTHTDMDCTHLLTHFTVYINTVTTTWCKRQLSYYFSVHAGFFRAIVVIPKQPSIHYSIHFSTDRLTEAKLTCCGPAIIEVEGGSENAKWESTDAKGELKPPISTKPKIWEGLK